MKNGFSKGYVDIPATKYYDYHGLIKPCNIQPEIPPLLDPENTKTDPIVWEEHRATWLVANGFEKDEGVGDHVYNEPWGYVYNDGASAIVWIETPSPSYTAWTFYIIFTRGNIACNAVKMYNWRDDIINGVIVDVRSNNTWVNIYDGVGDQDGWKVFNFDRPMVITAVRYKWNLTTRYPVPDPGYQNSAYFLPVGNEFYGYNYWLFSYKALDPTGDFIRKWLGGDIDERTILTGEKEGRVFISDDLGENFEELAPAGYFDKSWIIFRISHNIYMAVQEEGRVFISLDYGRNWEEVFPAGDQDEPWAAADVDVAEVVIASSPGRLYRSHNYGEDWTESRPGGDNDLDWNVVSIDGQYVLVGVYGGRLYTSNDYGATWTERRPAGNRNKNWRCGDIDQHIMAAGVYGGRFYVSVNYGVSWAERRPAGNRNKNWICCAIQGSLMVAGVYNGRLYISGDYGVTWEELKPAGAVDRKWYFSSISGEYIISGEDDGKLWRISIL